MDLIKQEIERKRKASAALAGNSAAGGKKKWVTKGDLEKARVAQYLNGKAQDEKARQMSSDARTDAAQPSAGAAASGGGDAASEAASAAGAGSSTEDLRPIDVKRRLRALGQPIQLFDEDDDERLERYRAVSSALPTESEVDRSDLKKGQMFNETQLYDEKGGAIQEGVQEEVEGMAESYKDDEELTATFIPTTPEQIVSRHFKELMQMWETELSERDAQQANMAEGKREMGAYLQARRHLRPFFKQLKTRSMPYDVLSTMVEITRHMQQREYVRANDAYIKCAIGNMPWPMGITGTGVHERQGRQHLRESKIAHVMNDETQRKYLQSVKRLMTFSQRALPADPSKCVS
mmetsp:Transcript_19495/g.39728  ORF Transcript_19495/g.39728 Transcript_19495/m.39728 type:complete len:349 (+) Transcript_19495:42-1088(+)